MSQPEPKDDPIASIMAALARIELLERQVRMLMDMKDAELRPGGAANNVSYAWPNANVPQNPAGT